MEFFPGLQRLLWRASAGLFNSQQCAESVRTNVLALAGRCIASVEAPAEAFCFGSHSTCQTGFRVMFRPADTRALGCVQLMSARTRVHRSHQHELGRETVGILAGLNT